MTAVTDEQAPEQELPPGFEISDGTTPINGEVHAAGVIVGPHEPGPLALYECPKCANEVEARSTPVCQGAILAIKDVKGVLGKKDAIIHSGFDEDGAPLLIPGGVPVLDDLDGERPEHNPTNMVMVTV